MKRKDNGAVLYVNVSDFYINNSNDGYRIFFNTSPTGNISSASTNINDHNMKMFTTVDKDVDNSAGNCAVTLGGPFWHNNCYTMHPFGPWTGTINSTSSPTFLYGGVYATMSYYVLAVKSKNPIVIPSY